MRFISLLLLLGFVISCGASKTIHNAEEAGSTPGHPPKQGAPEKPGPPGEPPSDGPQPEPPPVEPPPAPSPEPPFETVISAPLQTIASNQEISLASSNRVVISGSTKQYRIEYKFFSGENRSLKIFDVKTSSVPNSCGSLRERLVLKSGDKENRVRKLDEVRLEPHREYTLEVQYTQYRCPELQITVDVLAWAGSDDRKPTYARICRGERSPEMVFFAQKHSVVAYTLATKQTFLSDEVFCGNSYDSRGRCYNSFQANESFPRQSRCSAGYALNNRSFDILATPEVSGSTIQLTCRSQTVFNQDVSVEQFMNCRDVIADLSDYAS